MKLPPNKLFLHCFQQLHLIEKVIIIMKLEFRAINVVAIVTITHSGSNNNINIISFSGFGANTRDPN